MTANQSRAAPDTSEPAGAGPPLSATKRTRRRRLRHLGRTDRQSLYAVLQAGLVAHLGAITGGWPMVVPTCYGFDTHTLYLHGSVASPSLAATGTPVCVTITLTDGLVLARSVFERSVNYRSAMIYGRLDLAGPACHVCRRRLRRWSDPVRQPPPAARPPGCRSARRTARLNARHHRP